MQVGDVLDKKYKLVSQIGVGGMGSVWEALKLPQGRRVAVKSLHDHFVEEAELTERFLREARAALESRYSGHIIEVLDVVNKRGQSPYLVMEYLEGEDLYQIRERESALDITRAVDLIIQSCEAVDEVHRQGIIHRDIKPDNLFVTRLKDGSEWIKLLDFGVAKFSPNAPGKGYSLTKFGHTLGTPDYMAPEQAMGTGKIDYRVDIYSMGVVLYHLLAGRLPYISEDIQELMLMSARGNPPLLSVFRSEVPEALEQIIRKSMAVDRQERYQSMFDFAAALQPFSSKGGGRSRGRSPAALAAITTIRDKMPKAVVERLQALGDPSAFRPEIDPFAVTIRHEVHLEDPLDAPATLIESSPIESPHGAPGESGARDRAPRNAGGSEQENQSSAQVDEAAEEEPETIRDRNVYSDDDERPRWALWLAISGIAGLLIAAIAILIILTIGTPDDDGAEDLVAVDASTARLGDASKQAGTVDADGISLVDGGLVEDVDVGVEEPLWDSPDTGVFDDPDGAAGYDAASDADGFLGLDGLVSRDAAMVLLDELEDPEKRRRRSNQTKRRTEPEPEPEPEEAEETPAVVERRAVIRALRSLGPEIRGCLKRGRMTDTRVVARFHIKNDGSITYGGARPRLSWSTDRCIRRATSGKRTRTLTTGPLHLGFPYIAAP